MTSVPPMRLVMDPSTTVVRNVPASNAIRALLHHTGFRRVAATGVWELPQALPHAMRIARIAELIRHLDQARVPLALEDQRPMSTDLRQTQSRFAEIYSGSWKFADGHQPYILAIAATVQVRGLPIRDVTVKLGDLTDNPSAATNVSVKQRTAVMELVDGRAVTWDEATGWRDMATGAVLPISQVADPEAVATAVAALPTPTSVDTGRDPSRLDPLFEQALAAYRSHPGVEALQRSGAPDESGPYRLLPNEVRAIRQWQPTSPVPPRWEASAFVATDSSDRVSRAWTSPIRRSVVTSYRPASVAAQRQLRQARLQREANQNEGRQR